MTMPVLMRNIINISTLISFFLLLFYLNDYVKKKNVLGILIRVFFGVILVEGLDLLIGNRFEEVWLALTALGLLYLTFGTTKFWHLRNHFGFVATTILSYGVVMLSTTVTTVLVIAYAHICMNVHDLSRFQFNWITVFLIMIGQLLIAAILGIVIKRLYKVIKSYTVTYGKPMAATMITGLTLFVGAVIVIFDEFKRAGLPAEYLYLVLGIVLILMTIVIVGMLLYTQTLIRQNKINLEQENQKNLTLYVNQLERNYREVRKFRHDIVNALLALEVMINERGDSVLVRDYHALLTHYNFDTIQDQSIGRFQDINNAYIKGIIFSKYIEAHNNRISFNLEVQPALFKQQQQYFDELRILGIFLDNAIEAVAQMSEGAISVNLFEQNNKTVYSVKNTITEPVEFGKIYQSGYSTKGTNRGIGLATAKEITDARQDFRLILKQDGDYFVAMLVVELEETHG